jgi:hypothetical protein
MYYWNLRWLLAVFDKYDEILGHAGLEQGQAPWTLVALDISGEHATLGT